MELQSIHDIINNAEKYQLYIDLIHQLNKDFSLANIDVFVDEGIQPEQLKERLYTIINNLIKNNFSDYLNLLYIIDISEAKIKSLNNLASDDFLEKISFLILQREWKKVWLKKNYS